MSDLTAIEKRKLERTLGMSSGYVLDFSNRTFSEFFLDGFWVNIYDTKYDYGSGSKANRMRAFWEREGNYLVGKALGLLFKEWDEFKTPNSPLNPPKECLDIIYRLNTSADVPDVAVLIPNVANGTFEMLAKSVRESIERNEPEMGLDRLHTFLIKYFRVLCSNKGIDISSDKPLHSLAGEYFKALKGEGAIESEITERILKSSISIMEALNRVWNNQSFAHDNKILNYNESLLIFRHVTSSIRFIEAIESKHEPDINTQPIIDTDDSIPF